MVCLQPVTGVKVVASTIPIRKLPHAVSVQGLFGADCSARRHDQQQDIIDLYNE